MSRTEHRGSEFSRHPTLDRECFQKLLESAFAVQESGMKRHSLVAILELQRSIQMGHLDVDGAAHLIAEWARSVADASGVALGRLKGDQLIYTAGSGSATSYIGRRIMATFSTCSPNELSCEILRVEDTTTDSRIEAAVCRQFGVQSLLILPIYHGRFVAGVLQVLFNEAHSFHDQEVRTYWILAKLFGEAMSQAPVIQKGGVNIAPAVTGDVTKHLPVPSREPVNGVEARQVPAQIEKCQNPEVALDLPPDRSPLFNSRVMLRMNRVLAYKPRAYNLSPLKLPVYQRKRISGLVVASVTLVCMWILCTARLPTMSSRSLPALTSANVTTQQTPASDARKMPVTATSAAAFPAQPRYQTVRDVASSGRLSSDLDNRIKHFGNDVTVRYFTPRTSVIKMASGSETHNLSDDVTVRYFKPGNVDRQAEPVARGSR